MRIAYIAAGAAGMYCGSCLHDNTLAAALLDLGEDIILVPTYTALRTDEDNVSLDRVFFGGINVYLQQKLALFRRTPWWLDRLFDQPALLERATRGASAVDARQLGDMTVSMLRGEDGNQRKELKKLAHWLRAEIRPDIIHLSNALQLGMARLLRSSCNRPLVCQLSGEDLFLERLPPPYHDEARDIMRQRAADADAFVAINLYYANHMADYLAVDRRRVSVIPHGVRLEGHGLRLQKSADKPRVIGYFARICEDKGLHLLVEAGEHLAGRNDLPPFVLHAAGYLGDGDREYLKQLEVRARSGPLAGRFQYLGELDRGQKIAFLQSIDVFSVPTVYRESKGLPALEAMANAVPVVLPDHGSFSELVADSGGGLLCRPHDATDLADKLAELLRDSPRAAQLGLAGQKAIQDRYHAAAMARQTRELYERLISGSALGSLALGG